MRSLVTPWYTNLYFVIIYFACRNCLAQILVEDSSWIRKHRFDIVG